MPLRGIGVAERIQHADAFDGPLMHAVHRKRLGQPRGLEDGGRYVDDVVELRADLAFGLEAVRPVHDGAVARPAPVGGNLLGPLIRGAHRMRPAHGIVIVGLRPAELVVPLHEEFRRFEGRQAVEIGHFVVGAVQCAFSRCAIVTDDVVDERVVENVELLHAIEQASDVMVGVFQEARIDLHLAAKNGLERLRHVVPGRDLVMTRGEPAVGRDDA